MIRHRSAGLALALSLLLGAAACSDDGDDGGAGTTSTTTEADPGTTAGDPTTTLPGETTTTAAPPVAGPGDLQARLLDPAAFGEGFALDATLGTGAFSGELCEEVTLEPTWAEQASQALTRGDGADQQSVTQAVLDFASEGEAEAFVPAVVEGNETCLGDLVEVSDIDAGDEAVLIDIDSGETTTSIAVVRQGARAAHLFAIHPTDEGTPLTTEVLVAVGDSLAG